MPRRKVIKVKEEPEEHTEETNKESPEGDGDGRGDEERGQDSDSPTKKKRKQYPEEDLQRALKFIEEGHSVRTAARQFNVPRSTLTTRRLLGPAKVTGAVPNVRREDQVQLARYAVFMNDAGVPVTNQWMMQTAARMADLRGKPFESGKASRGWLHSFYHRHPDAHAAITHVKDLERNGEFSDAVTIGSFFREAEEFLTRLGVSKTPANIYNICEFAYTPTSKQLVKSISSKFSKLKDKTTLTVCVSADGQWLPVMFTFSKSQPMTSEFYMLGPPNALFLYSDSGENDNAAYLQYMKHLEPFLNKDRPVVIFQDNVTEYEDLDLVEFCIEKGIHVYNFPTELKNLQEPLDLLSKPLKRMMDAKHAEKLQQNTKINIPELVKMAVESLNVDIVRSAFEQTGIYPLNKEVITNKMLGMPLEKMLETASEVTEENVESQDSSDSPHDGSNDSGDCKNITKVTMKTKATQTLPVQSLPCSVCKKNEVPVHPGIAAGVLDFELASVFISETENMPDPITIKPAGSRAFDFSTGNWITHESRVQRLRNKRLGLPSPNDSESERRRKEKDLQRELKQAEKERKTQERKEAQQLVHGMVKSRVCVSCGVRPETCHTSVCVICERRFHNQCINEVVSVTVCPLCATK